MYNLLEYTSNYSNKTCSLRFYSKNESANFNANIANNPNFKSFSYKTKLLRSIEANGANGILRNKVIAVSLKYLSKFWESLERPLINCKVELKFKWKKHCVLSAASADDDDANPNNIIFTIKDATLCLCSHIIS